MRFPYLFLFRLILMVSAVIVLFIGVYNAAEQYEFFRNNPILGMPYRLILEDFAVVLFVSLALIAASEIVRLLQLVERHLGNIDTTLSLQYSREHRIEIEPHVPPGEDYYRPPNERFRR